MKPAGFLSVIAVATLAAPSVQAEILQTRYGQLRIDDTYLLFFQGRPVRPRIQGNSLLTFQNRFEFPGYDLVLIQDIGGSACPANYTIIRLDRRGVSQSGSFGTCSDLIEVRRTATGLRVRMPGFMGPLESGSARTRAARELHEFTYADGRVTERRIR